MLATRNTTQRTRRCVRFVAAARAFTPRGVLTHSACAAQFYEDMLQTLELEDAPQARSSGFLDGEGQGRWLTESIRRDEMDPRWADDD